MAAHTKGNRRLLLVGRTGGGKSATGNTIVGKKLFQVGHGCASETSVFACQKITMDGRVIEVTDCPGLFDTTLKPIDVGFATAKALACTNPGPHAVLFVIPINARFTPEEINAYKRMKTLLGEEVTKQMIIVFTHGDILTEKNLTEDYFKQRFTPELKNLLRECGQRYIIFNNKLSDPDRIPQVLKLIKMVLLFGEQHYDKSPYSKLSDDEIRKELTRRINLAQKEEFKNNAYAKELEKKKAEAEKKARAAQDAEKLANTKLMAQKGELDKLTEASKQATKTANAAAEQLEKLRKSSEKDREEILWQIKQMAAQASRSDTSGNGVAQLILGFAGTIGSILSAPVTGVAAAPLAAASASYMMQGAKKM